MIKDILQQIDGQLIKLGILAFGLLSLLFHILPKSEKKQETVGFFSEILNFVKAFFKK